MPVLASSTTFGESRRDVDIRPIRSKSVNELAGGSVSSQESAFVRAAAAKPIADLSNGEIRHLLLSGIGTAYLLPLALDRLAESPLLLASWHAGDLLCALPFAAAASLDAETCNRVRSLVEDAITELEAIEEVADSELPMDDHAVQVELDRDLVLPKLRLAHQQLLNAATE
jgi:hypothetical protein